LRDTDECYCFFEDICTVAELKSLAQRLEVAKMIQENRTYGEISGRTGASTATISRVKRALNYGADGYKLVIERLSRSLSR
jgi:TrpR-related protein YerC/YecD